MMYLWAPNQNSQRYAYSTQVDDCENSGAQLGIVGGRTVWAQHGQLADDDEGEQDDADSFWATTGGRTGGTPADVIGVSGPDQDRTTF
mmetsp:Transcript_55515/g.110329  ORF Transcript_55515/g.110329 Transcript_55515/m.110329 type:complete len:88 (+) Transcript_55515:1-264(+)